MLRCCTTYSRDCCCIRYVGFGFPPDFLGREQRVNDRDLMDGGMDTMSTPTGFMEYERELPADRSPLERVKDWGEFHKHLPEEQLRRREPVVWIAALHIATPELSLREALRMSVNGSKYRVGTTSSIGASGERRWSVCIRRIISLNSPAVYARHHAKVPVPWD